MDLFFLIQIIAVRRGKHKMVTTCHCWWQYKKLIGRKINAEKQESNQPTYHQLKKKKKKQRKKDKKKQRKKERKRERERENKDPNKKHDKDKCHYFFFDRLKTNVIITFNMLARSP